MGAGRTELLECLAGRIAPAGGRVLLEGADISGFSIAERASPAASPWCRRTGSATVSCRP